MLTSQAISLLKAPRVSKSQTTTAATAAAAGGDRRGCHSQRNGSKHYCEFLAGSDNNGNGGMIGGAANDAIDVGNDVTALNGINLSNS